MLPPVFCASVPKVISAIRRRTAVIFRASVFRTGIPFARTGIKRLTGEKTRMGKTRPKRIAVGRRIVTAGAVLVTAKRCFAASCRRITAARLFTRAVLCSVFTVPYGIGAVCKRSRTLAHSHWRSPRLRSSFDGRYLPSKISYASRSPIATFFCATVWYHLIRLFGEVDDGSDLSRHFDRIQSHPELADAVRHRAALPHGAFDCPPCARFACGGTFFPAYPAPAAPLFTPADAAARGRGPRHSLRLRTVLFQALFVPLLFVFVHHA